MVRFKFKTDNGCIYECALFGRKCDHGDFKDDDCEFCLGDKIEIRDGVYEGIDFGSAISIFSEAWVVVKGGVIVNFEHQDSAIDNAPGVTLQSEFVEVWREWFSSETIK